MFCFFTLVFDCAAAAARSVGAEGGAGSDDWEGLERNLGWLKAGSQLPAPSTHLASGNLSWTSCASPKSAIRNITILAHILLQDTLSCNLAAGNLNIVEKPLSLLVSSSSPTPSSAMSVNPEVVLVSLSLHFLICEGLYLRLSLLSFHKHISVEAGSVSHPSSATSSRDLWGTDCCGCWGVWHPEPVPEPRRP